jgi:hypothetical protein
LHHVPQIISIYDPIAATVDRQNRPVDRKDLAQWHIRVYMKIMQRRIWMMLAVSLAALSMAAPGWSADRSREQVIKIVTRIQRADFEGDRSALKRLYGELGPFVENRKLAARVRYWRGFALWRRALNAQNESAGQKEIEDDLTQAAAEFHAASTNDPAWSDAKGGEAFCLVGISAMHLKEPRAREMFLQSRALLSEALAAAPDNPRLLWLQGGYQYYGSPEQGGGQSVALATYEKALELARRQKGRVTDPLEPAWGEPELLMTLAYTNLNRTTPDVAAAERYAQDALALVPYWHYVRDILMPQILEARRKQQGTNMHNRESQNTQEQ